MEAAMAVGEDCNGAERIAILARTSEGDIFDHKCDAEENENMDCNCSCQRS